MPAYPFFTHSGASSCHQQAGSFNKVSRLRLGASVRRAIALIDMPLPAMGGRPMRTVNLDIALLRTFVLAHRLGSLARAAEAVGRSQSAVSQQISRLEGLLAQPLFDRQARSASLTQAGVVALSFAEKMLQLNDELVRASADGDKNKAIRLGMSPDFPVGLLPPLLHDLRQDNPDGHLSIVTERHSTLSEKLSDGSLDLALMFSEMPPDHAHSLGRVRQVWLGLGHVLDRPGPLPLVVMEGQCQFRTRAIHALAAAGIASHVAVSCSSLAALRAAVESGCGIALRTVLGAPASLVLDASLNALPPLPEIDLCLHQSPHGLSKAAEQLRRRIVENLPQRLPACAAGTRHVARPGERRDPMASPVKSETSCA